jgi:hypothetical protein
MFDFGCVFISDFGMEECYKLRNLKIEIEAIANSKSEIEIPKSEIKN